MGWKRSGCDQVGTHTGTHRIKFVSFTKKKNLEARRIRLRSKQHINNHNIYFQPQQHYANNQGCTLPVTVTQE